MIARRVTFLVFLLSTILVTSEGWAMGKHVHYVDVSAPEKVYKDRPTGEWTRKIIQGPFYKIAVQYPEDHRVKGWPGRQWSSLSVAGTRENPIEYRILKYEILSSNINQIQKVTYDFERQQKGYQEIKDILDRPFKDKGLRPSFTAFTTIPPDTKEIQINIEIEITSSKGEKALVKESIPLKRSYYKTSFWEGLRP